MSDKPRESYEEVTAAMLKKNGWIGAADLLLTLRESVATQADRIVELEEENKRLRNANRYLSSSVKGQL